jgi:hypothetical protein
LQDWRERSHFTSVQPLSSYAFTDGKTKTGQLSQVILIVCNYHFVRSHANTEKCPRLRPQDVSISLKVSSSVFKTAGASSSSDDQENVWFDQSGAQMPYATFVSLMDDKTFTDEYMMSVRADYERTEGNVTGYEEEPKDDGNAEAGSGERS